VFLQRVVDPASHVDEAEIGVVAVAGEAEIDAAHAGETILVAKDGKPWARLVPLETDRPRRQPGLLRGQLQLPPIDGLLAPLPPEELDGLDAPLPL
jgi:antitoxin (DNA-binding transcriptional repressor) of toxin-antitoxin stability system